MLNITIATWIDAVHGDDYYYLNIRRNKEQLFLGYEHEVPDDLKKLRIDTVYVDFASEAFGIKVI